MAGASTTQFMNQKLQEETPIFSKVFHINVNDNGNVRLEATLPYLEKYDKFTWCSPPLTSDKGGLHSDPPFDSPCCLQLTYCYGSCKQVD